MIQSILVDIHQDYPHAVRMKIINLMELLILIQMEAQVKFLHNIKTIVKIKQEDSLRNLYSSIHP